MTGEADTRVGSRVRLLAYLTLCLVAMLWGSSGVIIRHILLPAAWIVLLRASSATMCLLAMRLWTRPSGATGPRTGRDGSRFLILSGVLLALHWVTLVAALQRAPVGVVLVGVYVAPVLVTLIAPSMLGEVIRWQTILALTSVTAGSVLMFRPGGTITPEDIALIAGSATLFAASIVVTKRAVTFQDPLVVTLVQLGIVSVLSLPIALTQEASPDWASVALVLVLGLLHTGVAQLLYSWCLTIVPATTSAVLLCLESVSGLVLGWALLAEHPSGVTIFGAGLVVGAALLVALQPPNLQRK